MRQEIWLLLDSRAAGGIETHVLQLAVGLQAEKQLVRVVFMNDYGPHPLKNLLNAKGIPYMLLAGTLKSVILAINEYCPKVLHTHGYKAGLLGRIGARICGVRVVSTYHAGESSRGKLALYDWIDRHTSWLAHKTFSVSALISSKVPGNPTVLNNFIDTERLTMSQGKQIAFVGRLSHEKGPDRFAKIAKAFPHQFFHVYGSGPLQRKLQNIVPKNLTLHGQQESMDKIWNRIGLLVMPSRFEGLPMAAIEAMARQIPVIASRVGAFSDLIEHNVNGWLVEQEDEKAYIQCVQSWLDSNSETCQRMGHAARRTVDAEYASRAIVPKIMAEY